jgi:hypothetical protein
MTADKLKPNLILQGSLFPEAVLVLTTLSFGDSVKIMGQGLRTNQVYQPILTAQLATLPETEPFDAANFEFLDERLVLEVIEDFD